MTADQRAVDQKEPAEARSTTLLRNGTIHNPADPLATAMVVEDGMVAWVGSEGAADAHADSVREVIDLRGALVTPAFVDAHVHATSTGLALTGLDLSGCASRAEALDRIAVYAAALPDDAAVLGTGWDETAWDRTAPDGRQPPTRAELDRAAGGRRTYLARVDVHSAVVSSSLLDAAPQARACAGYQEDGPLSRAAHHEVRAAALASITASQRADAQRAALRRAAECGIAAVHECGGPQISGEEDFTALIALAADPANAAPYVFGYWGELTDPVKAFELGGVGAGGDVFIDGAIGSHTACLREPYADAAETGLGAASGAGYAGAAYLTAEQIGGFLVSCVEAGVQPGFHVIGDYGLDLLVAGLDLAHDLVGEKRLRAVRVRAEHAEMPDSEHIKKFAHHGVVVSAQPGFDAAWGGADGMYVRRLGPGRALGMNPFAALSAAGVVLAFGSDSPVIPLGPWEAVRAAVFHHTPASRLTARAAFEAHTRGGWRALNPAAAGVPRDETGVLAPGAPATYAVWETGGLVAQAPDQRATGRSRDQRAAAPALPDLAPGVDLPRCLRTAVRGRPIHDHLLAA
ncbi:amidohydrolase family protein [Actinocrinis puniceicyclus]|uniref:Amidohydrolase family protein n=1 Tax=Actinocrinis puniceicyclus TaxID=977794 RepID=A0A8J7WLF8_9ACTN|nr:amidohydrolase family protein [Actinocrinis puniceicyclus]MBS2963005.1 amidohydrolase family protein [Actinocrinis puniceicyclus]